MKTQRSLATTGDKTLNFLISEVTDRQKKIAKLVEDRTTDEQNLAGYLIELIEKKERYPEFEKILSTKLFEKVEKRGNILTHTCTEIARSLAEYWDKEEGYPNGRINWGAQFYDIPKVEIEEKIGVEDHLGIEYRFDHLNNFLKEFNIVVKFRHLNYDEDGSTKSARIEIQIFPD